MPSSTITVRYGKTNKPARNIRVALGFSGILGGGMANGHTDSSGNASINHTSEGTAKVYVDGKEVGEMRAPGAFNVNI